LEQFTDDWEKRWKASHAKKDDKSTEEEWAYIGNWAVEEPSVLKGMEGDKGLVIKDKAAHHAISAKFPKAINNKGKTLVVQYEVKLQSEFFELETAFDSLLTAFQMAWSAVVPT
jgi:calnexin